MERREDKDESGYAGTGDDQEFTDPTPFMKTNLDSPLHSSSPQACSCLDNQHELSPGHYKAIQREGMDDAGYYKIVSREGQKNKLLKGGHDKLKKYKDEAIYENPLATSRNTF